LKVLTIVGARPQFIKAAPVSRVLRAHHQEVLVHTGQHYDDEMSAVFFRELAIPQPDYNLGIGSGSHGRQTGQMLIALEELLLREQPERVLVYGDTNSTLAGALAAVKLHISIAHVEAGLRSFNRAMPEEHNRILTDHCSDLLFCPTQTAVEHLAAEGIRNGVRLVGDTMFDAVLQFREIARERSTILDRLELAPGGYLLATVHRPYNTDTPAQLQMILAAFAALEEPVVFPVHPRTRKKIAELAEAGSPKTVAQNVRMIDPVGYLDMLMLEQSARLLLTDSGGMQKEAFWLNVPCVTLRPETEWVETVEAGWNRLAWDSAARIIEAVRAPWPATQPPPLFGDGRASERIVDALTAPAHA
jgi:UDP-GlcNAc3NAcA epimerase